MKKNETATLSYLATTLVGATRDGLISKSVLDQLRTELMDAHMSMTINAEGTDRRLAIRRGDLLGSFGDLIEEAFDRNAAAIARDNRDDDLCPDCGHDMDDHDMRDSPPTCLNERTPCAFCGKEATLTVDNTIPSNMFPSIPLEKHVPMCAPCWSEIIDPGAMYGQ